MHLFKERLNDSFYRAGIGLIALSLLVFCLPFMVTMEENADFGLFIFNYMFTGIYFLVRVFNKSQIEKENKIHHLFLLLILFLISAYSLNREITVFESSVDWFSGLLVLLCCNYILFAFFNSLPQWARHTISFLNGVGFVTFLYLSIYLLAVVANRVSRLFSVRSFSSPVCSYTFYCQYNHSPKPGIGKPTEILDQFFSRVVGSIDIY